MRVPRLASMPSSLFTRSICLDGTLGGAYAARGSPAVYEDQTSPTRQARPAQGQRCPSCGHVDPDPLARFCGVCGSMMGPAASAGGAPGGYPAVPTAQFPAHGYDPPARHAPSAPPIPAYAPHPGQLSTGNGPQPVIYAVPSIDLVGAGQIGAAISAVFSLLPCLMFAWGGSALVSGIRWVLDSWTTASIRIPIPIASIDVPVNYIDLFRLRSFYNAVVFWDDRVWLTFALLFLVPWIFSIVSGALYGSMLAAVYNAVGRASGGMRVTLVSAQIPPSGQAAPPAAWAPDQPPGPPLAWPNQGRPPDQRR